ncbi:MAG: hypothetical protein R6X02_32825 [Enhygromyxa sp.]
MSDEATIQLSYAITTDPNPLQANPSGSDSLRANMTLLVSNPTGQYITVNSITVTIPVGANASNLTADPSSIRTGKPEGWTIDSSGGVFVLTPSPGNGTLGREGLSFAFNNIIPNDQVGTASVGIAEDTGQTADTSIPVSKFPPQFSVSDFKATPPNVDPGGSTTLSWSGSEGASYAIAYGSTTVPNLGPKGPYVATELQSDTVFTLIVSSSSGGDPIESQLQLTVTVNRPQVFDFYADADIVYRGEGTALHWATSGVSSTELKENGVPLFSDGPAQSPAEGYAVTPRNSTTTYELVAKGSSGVDTREDRNVFAKTLQLQGVAPLAPGSFGVAVADELAYIVNPTTGTLDVVAISSGALTARIPVGVAPTGVALSGDRTRAYVTNRSDDSISVIDTASNEVVQTITGVPSPYGVAVLGATAYVANFDGGGVSIVSLEDGSVAGTLATDAAPTGVAASPDGTTLYVASYTTAKVAVIDIASNSITARMEVGALPTGVAVSANGGSVYVVSRSEPYLYVMDPRQYMQLARVSSFSGPLGVGVSANGATVLVTTDLGLTNYILDLF